MKLAAFIQGLITRGAVEVSAGQHQPADEDRAETASFLKAFYLQDQLEMPFDTPSFCPEAAIWSADYFYQSVQLTVLRDLDESILLQRLKAYPKPITPEAIYSADLVMRHLPDLFELAKGLAPADLLVEQLHITASAWPFSSVGVDLTTDPDVTVILSHPSLQQTYIDRIIEKKAFQRINNQQLRELLQETAGSYLATFWPGHEQMFTTISK